MDKIRETALVGIYNIIEKKAFANITVNNLLKGDKYSSLERRFITELVYGTVRHQNTLEWIIKQHISEKQKLDSWIKNILLLGVYQIFYLDRVPDSAACNESVELAKKYGNPGSVRFVNGVLRNIARNIELISFPDINIDPVLHISIAYSHPEWMVKRWIEEFGEKEAIAICKYNNSKAPNTIRTNTLKISPENLKALMLADEIEVKKTLYAPEGLEITNFENITGIEAFKKGFFLMQDEASMLVSRALSPQKEKSLIVDACAAPGTKTTHLAQLSNDKGTILAYDMHPQKLPLILENADRLGIKSIVTKTMKAQELPNYLKDQVDYLLLDVPCSGLGILRRRPDLRWNKTLEQIKNITEIQLEILSQAALSLKVGGVLVYSTCTIMNEENVDVVDAFLSKNKNYEFESLVPFLPGKLISQDDKLLKTAEEGYVQFFPHRHKIDGFFVARIKRIA